MPLHPWLDFDLSDATEHIPHKKREIVSSTLLRRGCVIAGSSAGSTSEQVERVFHDIRTKRSTTRPLHLGPVLVEAVPEIKK